MIPSISLDSSIESLIEESRQAYLSIQMAMSVLIQDTDSVASDDDDEIAGLDDPFK